jgi:hypothetical protein
MTCSTSPSRSISLFHKVGLAFSWIAVLFFVSPGCSSITHMNGGPSMGSSPPLIEASACSIPQEYPPSRTPDLANVEVSRWWCSFQDVALNQTIHLAALHSLAIQTPTLQTPTQPSSLDARRQIQDLVFVTSNAYFDKLLANSQIALAEQQIASASEAVGVAQRRFDDGEVGQADVILARSHLEKSRAWFSECQLGWIASDQRLRKLVGHYHNPDTLLANQATQIPTPLFIDVAAPSQLFQRRSDLAAFETRARALASQHHMLQSNLAEHPGHYSNVHAIAAVQAALNDTLASYQEGASKAYAEVAEALEKIPSLDEQVRFGEQSVASDSLASALLADQYKVGRVSVSEFIATQANWFESQRRLLSLKCRRCRNFAALYHAVGGGDVLPTSPDIVPLAMPLSLDQQPDLATSVNSEYQITLSPPARQSVATVAGQPFATLGIPVGYRKPGPDITLFPPKDYGDQASKQPSDQLGDQPSDQLGEGTVFKIHLAPPTPSKANATVSLLPPVASKTRRYNPVSGIPAISASPSTDK